MCERPHFLRSRAGRYINIYENRSQAFCGGDDDNYYYNGDYYYNGGYYYYSASEQNCIICSFEKSWYDDHDCPPGYNDCGWGCDLDDDCSQGNEHTGYDSEQYSGLAQVDYVSDNDSCPPEFTDCGTFCDYNSDCYGDNYCGDGSWDLCGDDWAGYDECTTTSYYWDGSEDLSDHDSSKCREYSCDSHDDDCCGYDYETWCADGYTLVRGNEGEHDCWPGQKGYRCMPNGDDDDDCVEGDYGATDPYGDGCAAYVGNPSWCGPTYDDDDFSADVMCCECGGGASDDYDEYDDDDAYDSCCEPEEHHADWDEAFDFCESTGMRQVASRDDDGEERCSYHDNPNNADEYTHDCCAEDFEVYMHADRNYWISVTGARATLAQLHLSPFVPTWRPRGGSSVEEPRLDILPLPPLVRAQVTMRSTARVTTT